MNLSKLVFRLLLGRRLPITTGTLRVSGITKPVLIRRDGYGIPYIEAETDWDAWYGLGFCHGQDRAFQIEGYLRVVRGTLAELMGPIAVPIDRLSRRTGFSQASEEQMVTLDNDARQTLEAYAQGVSDGATLGCRRRAHEFTLLRGRPTPYRATDVLGMLKVMSFTAGSNWDSELARLKILTEDGPEALEALSPVYPEWLPVTSPPGETAGGAVDRLTEDLAVFMETVGLGGCSNNWAIAPSHTTTGRPILANDPHLPSVLPPYWYLAHIRTPEWAVAGASFVGSPTFPAGHNGTGAWGVTFGFADNTDLFMEEMGPDGRSIREGDSFVPCITRRETIHVKGGESVEEDVLVGPRGPIIGPALDGEVGAVSMRAVWLDPRPSRGLLHIHRAGSFEEFRRTFEQWPALSINMVYADVTGTVGWQMAGEVPRRRKGWGTLPLAGWDTETGWEDTPVPFDEMPHVVDPKTGIVATANNQPTIEGTGPFLGVDWIDGYRYARIMEVLMSRDSWDLEGVRRLQMDQESLPWREMRGTVLASPSTADETREALSMLETWDGRVAADSPAATVFQLFLAGMARKTAEVKAPKTARWALGKGFSPLTHHNFFSARWSGHLARLIREQPGEWFERSWQEEIADTLGTVIRSLGEEHGKDPSKWAWGRVRQLILSNPAGERSPLNRVFNLGPFPWGGDANTVGQAAADPADPTANPHFIASLRMVVDVGNWDEGRFILPGGQSGNPLSPHYSDQLPLWRCGEGATIAWSPTEVKRVCGIELRLEPNHSND